MTSNWKLYQVQLKAFHSADWVSLKNHSEHREKMSYHLQGFDLDHIIAIIYNLHVNLEDIMA